MSNNTLTGLVIDRKLGESIMLGDFTEMIFEKAMFNAKKIRLRFVNHSKKNLINIARKEIYGKPKKQKWKFHVKLIL